MARFQLFPLAWLQVLILFSLSHFSTSKNILVWSAIGSHSIRLSMTPFMEALVDRGHNVTFLTAFEDFESKGNQSRIHTFAPPKWKEMMGGDWDSKLDFYGIRNSAFGIPKAWYDVRAMGLQACEAFYTDPQFLQWVKASPGFDLVVVEMLVNECAFGLAHLWGSKLIIYSTTSVLPGFLEQHGLPDESSSLNDIFFWFPSGRDTMTFGQRLISALNPVVYSLTKEYSYYPALEEITRMGYRNLGLTPDKVQVPSFAEMERKVSLVLITSHFAYEFPRALPPNVVPIGGSVVGKNKKPLDKETEAFLDEAKAGFIYLSFGTMVEFTSFEMGVQYEFVKALEAFPEVRFLWKSTTKINMSLPDNVLVTSWTPQQTVLAHPNIKAFISHSGMGGTAEAIHFSVPMICIPIVADQDHNADAIVSKGAGIRLELINLKREQLENAIYEILTNEKYKEAMNRITEIYNDQPSPPLETAIWWVEFIMRHENSNEFLRPFNVGQPWWKRRQIDVWITVFLFFVGIFTTTLMIVRKLLLLIYVSLKSGKESQRKRIVSTIKNKKTN